MAKIRFCDHRVVPGRYAARKPRSSGWRRKASGDENKHSTTRRVQDSSRSSGYFPGLSRPADKCQWAWQIGHIIAGGQAEPHIPVFAGAEGGVKEPDGLEAIAAHDYRRGARRGFPDQFKQERQFELPAFQLGVGPVWRSKQHIGIGEGRRGMTMKFIELVAELVR